jgi:hypothetical protein
MASVLLGFATTYVNSPTGTCRNDGRQPNDEVWLYTSKKDCCRNDQVEYDSCMEDKVMEPVTTGTGDGEDPETVTNEYYPD